MAVHSTADLSGNYTSAALPPGKYRVLAITQLVRWDVPEDLEKLQLALLEGKLVELDGASAVRISLQPVVLN
jgi:hypothetical protein